MRERSTPPVEYSKKVPRPQGTSPKNTPPTVEKSTPPVVCSNLLKEPEERHTGADAFPPVDAGEPVFDFGSAPQGDSAAAPAGAEPVNGSAARSAREDARVAFDLFVEMAKRCGLSVPRDPDTRLKKIATRIKQNGLAGWREMLAKVEASPFLQGRNDKGWRPGIDWFLEPLNFEKVLDGNYDNRACSKSSKPLSRY